MLVLKQNNSGFVDLDMVPTVHVVKSCTGGRIEAVSAYGHHFWLGDYTTVERANEVLMQLYAAKKAHSNDFTMPPNKECNDDYCDI
jgi:hypothetical protein